MITHEFFEGNALSEVEQIRLVSRVSKLYRLHNPDATETDMRHRLFGNRPSFVDLLLDGNVAVAFAVCTIKTFSTGETCLWRNGIVVAPAYRELGLYRTLVELALRKHRTEWSATKTQNPRVYLTWLKLFGERLLPYPGKDPAAPAQRVASELSGDHGNPVDPLTFVIKNEYSIDRSGTGYFNCHTPWVADFFTSRLGPFDAFLLLAHR